VQASLPGGDARIDGRVEVSVAVRPEKISLAGGSPSAVRLQGTVLEHVFRGSQHAYLVEVRELARTMYVYQQAGAGALDPGTSVPLFIEPADLIVLADDAGDAGDDA
jgi:hypothetical protein